MNTALNADQSSRIFPGLVRTISRFSLVSACLRAESADRMPFAGRRVARQLAVSLALGSDRVGAQPDDHFVGVLVRGKNGIEDLFDTMVADDERQPLQQGHAVYGEARQLQRLRQREVF